MVQLAEVELGELPRPSDVISNPPSASTNITPLDTSNWTKVSDLAERSRIQNRIAQRAYRKNVQKRIELLKQESERKKEGEESVELSSMMPADYLSYTRYPGPDDNPPELPVDSSSMSRMTSKVLKHDIFYTSDLTDSTEDVVVESPDSDESYTIRTGIPEASVPPHGALGYTTIPVVPRHHHRHTSSASSFTISSQPPSLYVTEGYQPTVVDNPASGSKSLQDRIILGDRSNDRSNIDDASEVNIDRQEAHHLRFAETARARRNARLDVMQKARRERPWSTSKPSVQRKNHHNTIYPTEEAAVAKPAWPQLKSGKANNSAIDHSVLQEESEEIYDNSSSTMASGGGSSLKESKNEASTVGSFTTTIRPLKQKEKVLPEIGSNSSPEVIVVAPRGDARLGADYQETSVRLHGGRSSSSYRSGTSVGTGIGSDTDDTDVLDFSDAESNAREHRGKAALHQSKILPALAEESSDEDYIFGEEKEKNSFGDAHMLWNHSLLHEDDWKEVRTHLPDSWMWDVDYHNVHTSRKGHGCWTCTPNEPDDPENFPLIIAGAPVVIPVDYRWPPIAGVNPPPDPRPSRPIDCTTALSMDVIKDLFLTFRGSTGFYLLVNGLLQIIVPETFDTVWASSHLPHKYGGLRISYIHQSIDPTMAPSKTETMKSKASQNSQASRFSNIFNPPKASTSSLTPTLKLNDFIEARTKTSHRKEKFAGRIGLKVAKYGDPYVVMSSHVITEAILSKSSISSIFRRGEQFDKLGKDWNGQIQIWAGNEKIGAVEKTFDPEAGTYPVGFKHDITLIKPSNFAAVKDIHSPITDLGWLSQEGWNSLRQQSSAVKILGETENHRAAKTLKANRPSEVLVVGEGIFLNQTASRPTLEHDKAVWEDMVSRAVLYRVYPDFDPPNGYSGIALYTDGLREDGTIGPAVLGFQSFVQRGGPVQNFEMEGGALDKRLKLGRVAFYGAFQVPESLRKDFSIV